MILVKAYKGESHRTLSRFAALVVIIVEDVVYCTTIRGELRAELTRIRQLALNGKGPIGKRHRRWCRYWSGRSCRCDGDLEPLPLGRRRDWEEIVAEIRPEPLRLWDGWPDEF